VVAGPSTIHAYSGSDGTRLFTTAALTGTDRDCQSALASAARGETSLQADRVVTFNVPAGEVACVETTSGGNHELQWHQTEHLADEGATLAKSN
jgi:hypothetical protein